MKNDEKLNKLNGAGAQSAEAKPGLPSRQVARARSELDDGSMKPAVNPGSSDQNGAADEVVRSFNTWAFKREQPSDPDKLQRVVAEAMARGEPVSFVLYWGKGPRERLDAPDIACLDYLDSLGQRVRAAYAPGAHFTLIFTDTHAKLNGYTPQGWQRYFSAVDARARQHGFSSCMLGQLTSAASEEGPIETVTELPEDIREILCESAAKWYRGEGGVEQGALKYYQGNLVEKRAVEIAFPRSIFITFNGSKLLKLFPSRMPIFYMYSLRRGFGIKPWFLSVDATRADEKARERVA